MSELRERCEHCTMPHDPAGINCHGIMARVGMPCALGDECTAPPVKVPYRADCGCVWPSEEDWRAGRDKVWSCMLGDMRGRGGPSDPPAMWGGAGMGPVILDEVPVARLCEVLHETEAEENACETERALVASLEQDDPARCDECDFHADLAGLLALHKASEHFRPPGGTMSPYDAGEHGGPVSVMLSPGGRWNRWGEFEEIGPDHPLSKINATRSPKKERSVLAAVNRWIRRGYRALANAWNGI